MHFYYNIKSTPHQLFFVSVADDILVADQEFADVFGKSPTKIPHITNRKHPIGYTPGNKKWNFHQNIPKKEFYYSDLKRDIITFVEKQETKFKRK